MGGDSQQLLRGELRIKKRGIGEPCQKINLGRVGT